MSIGSCPVGTASVGTACAQRTVRPEIDDVEFLIDPLDLVITIRDQYFIEDVEFQHEIDDIIIVQEGVWYIDDVTYEYEIPHTDPATGEDGVRIGQRHALALEDVAYGFELIGDSVQVRLLLAMDAVLELPREVGDVAMTMTHTARGMHVDFPWDIDPDGTLAVVQRNRLTIETNELFHGVPDIWLFLPSKCLSYSSTRERDGGLKLDQAEGGTPQAERWYTEDRYRFRLVWEAVDAETMEGIRGFFESYRYQDFIFYWREDNTQYRAMIAKDVQANRVQTFGYWNAEVEIVGTQVNQEVVDQLMSKGMRKYNGPGSK